jgi:hypothetical protein
MNTTPNDQTGDRAAQFLASTFTLLAISWIVYCLRLYTRLRLVHHIFLEDYLIIFAMVRVNPPTNPNYRSATSSQTPN